jgi:hypothetical protein
MVSSAGIVQCTEGSQRAQLGLPARAGGRPCLLWCKQGDADPGCCVYMSFFAEVVNSVLSIRLVRLT